MDYYDLQKKVFDWLMQRHKVDNNFTFAVRKRITKGAERNIFIGTEKSHYFATTLWKIPVSYPGSSTELISIVINIDKGYPRSYIEFYQTKTPDNDQNKYALELIRNIKTSIQENENIVLNGDNTQNKMEHFFIHSEALTNSLGDVLIATENLVNQLLPIIDKEIEKLKGLHPTFVAERITKKDFDQFIQKMENRIKQYAPKTNESQVNSQPTSLNMKNISLNTILYGPPGTGKTYKTIDKALEIIFGDELEKKLQDVILNDEEKSNSIKLVERKKKRILFDAHLRTDKNSPDYQIVFTTFHQSMTYEDFVEGIKPEIDESEDSKSIVYDIHDGIFKQICQKANELVLSSGTSQESIYGFDEAWSELIDEIETALNNGKSYNLDIQTDGKSFKVESISNQGNILLKPNSSPDALTYTESYKRTKMLHERFPDLSIVQNIDKEFRSVIGGSNSTAYWAVLNNINKRLLQKNNTNKEDKLALNNKNYVLIIDEINRGNVSAIFGELITLIEESKRAGKHEALTVTLPYSKETFSVPSNVYIIGTMNTADRSVEALDTALRRRFSFQEMMPDYILEELQYDLFGPKASDILKTINERICVLLDREHQIGHSYFIGKDENTILDSFYKNIIPLLQEYFFGDYGKIGLVLGNGFVRKVKREKEKQLFAKFDDYNDANQYDDLERFEIIPKNEVDINTAIQSLMN